MAEAATTIGTADVEVRAKIDQFDNDLKKVHEKLSRFDQATDNSSKRIKQFENNTKAAASASGVWSAALGKVESGLAALQRMDAQVVNSIESMVVANDNMAKSTKEATAAQEKQGKALKDTSKGFIEHAGDVFKLATVVKLGAAAFYVASPAFRGYADSLGSAAKAATATLPSTQQVGQSIASLAPIFNRAGAAVNGLHPSLRQVGSTIASFGTAATKTGSAVGGIGPAVTSVTQALGPFNSILGAAGIAGMATTFPAAAAGAYLLVPPLRQVSNQQVVGGLQAIPKALGSISPAASQAASSFISFAAPMLSFITRVGLIAAAVIATVKGLIAIFNLGREAVDKFAEGAEKAGYALDVAKLTQYTEALKKFHVEGSLAADAFKKFYESSKEKLGGSDLDKLLHDQVLLGNLVGNTYLKQAQMATDVEFKFKSIVNLMKEASEKGEYLAALKIAEKILPPELYERMRAMPDFLSEWIARGEKAKEIDLIGEHNLVRASVLKGRLDAAMKIITAAWDLHIKPILTSVGLEFYAVWVKLLELVAGFFTMVGNIAGAIGSAFKAGVTYVQEFSGWLKTNLNILQKTWEILTKVKEQSGSQGKGEQLEKPAILMFLDQMGVTDWLDKQYKVLVDWMDRTMEIMKNIIGQMLSFLEDMIPPRLKAIFRVVGAVAGPVYKAVAEGVAHAGEVIGKAYETATKDVAKLEEAEKKSTEAATQLANARQHMSILMRQEGEVLRQTGAVYQWYNDFLGDLSKPGGIFDQTIHKMQRHIELTKATTAAIGSDVGARETLRAKTELENLVKDKGIKLTEQQKKQLEDIPKAIGAEALAEDRAKIAYDLKRESQQLAMRLSEDEIRIADKLKEVLPGISEALRSELGIRMKLNEATKRTREIERERELLSLTEEEVKIADRLRGSTRSVTEALNSKDAALIRSNESLKRQIDLDRQLKEVALTDEDLHIWEKLRDVYKTMPEALNSWEASQMRIIDSLKQARDIGQTFVTDFAQGLRQGEGALKSLSNALNKLADKLVEMAVQQLWQKAFGGAFNSVIGSLFGTSYGGGGVGDQGPTLAMIKHSGGMIGSGSGVSRMAPMSMFMGAPRFHDGINLASDEIPAILQKGERVIPKGQNDRGVNINQHFQFVGADPSSEARLRVQLEQVKREAVRMAVQEVAKARRNNPGYLQ